MKGPGGNTKCEGLMGRRGGRSGKVDEGGGGEPRGRSGGGAMGR